MIRATNPNNLSNSRSVVLFLVAMAAATAASCESCGQSRGGSSSGLGSGGGGWLVGQAALMVNVPHDPARDIGHYKLDVSDDLNGIACRGTTDAWVVGDRGLLLATKDAGVSWRVVDPGVTTTLRAVALAAPDTVYVAGDDGVARASFDGGDSFQTIATPALGWTSVATRKSDGAVALFASATGEIYRYEAAERLAG